MIHPERGELHLIKFNDKNYKKEPGVIVNPFDFLTYLPFLFYSITNNTWTLDCGVQVLFFNTFIIVKKKISYM